MKIYFNWIWILGLAIVGYAVYKHFKASAEILSPPTGDAFSTINTNLSQVTDE